MLTAIDHIEIIVPDVHEYVSFLEKFGCKVLRWTDHHEGSAELQIPGSNQPLFEIHQVLTEENPGINHIAFRVDDIGKAYDTLVSRGVNFYMGVHPSVTGRRNAELRDPAGWRIQLTDKKREPVKEWQHDKASGTNEATSGVIGIDHIEIVVPDVKRYVEFMQKLGFIVRRWTDHHGGSAELQLPGEGQPLFEIHQVSGEENPGINHIALKVRDVQAVHAELRSKGLVAELEPKVSMTGRRNAELRDPMGFRLQLTDERREAVKERAA